MRLPPLLTQGKLARSAALPRSFPLHKLCSDTSTLVVWMHCNCVAVYCWVNIQSLSISGSVVTHTHASWIQSTSLFSPKAVPSNPRLLKLFIGSFPPVDLPCCHAGDFTGVGVNALEGVLRAQSFPIFKSPFGVDFAKSLIVEIRSRVDKIQDQLAFESRKPNIVDGTDIGESGGTITKPILNTKKKV